MTEINFALVIPPHLDLSTDLCVVCLFGFLDLIAWDINFLTFFAAADPVLAATALEFAGPTSAAVASKAARRTPTAKRRTTLVMTDSHPGYGQGDFTVVGVPAEC